VRQRTVNASKTRAQPGMRPGSCTFPGADAKIKFRSFGNLTVTPVPGPNLLACLAANPPHVGFIP